VQEMPAPRTCGDCRAAPAVLIADWWLTFLRGEKGRFTTDVCVPCMRAHVDRVDADYALDGWPLWGIFAEPKGNNLSSQARLDAYLVVLAAATADLEARLAFMRTEGPRLIAEARSTTPPDQDDLHRAVVLADAGAACLDCAYVECGIPWQGTLQRVADLHRARTRTAPGTAATSGQTGMIPE
jgi:hypothetical protein